MSSVFVRPGHSQHTSGPTKGGSSPVEEASENSSFFLSESTGTLSGLSANDERLLKQRGAHCSLAHVHLALMIEEKVLFWDDRVTDRLTREAGTLRRPLRVLRRPPQSSANELLSQPRGRWVATRRHLHTPPT